MKRFFSKAADSISAKFVPIQTAVASAINESPAVESFLKGFNEYKSEVSKAMDEAWLEAGAGGIDLKTGLQFTPSNHRVLDEGHTLLESMNRADAFTDFDSFMEWAKCYASDLSSPAGMPAFGRLSDDIYSFLREQGGIDEATARDWVTVNGQEALTAIIGGTISAVALTLAWKREDKEAFSRAVASIGIGAIVFANPVALSIAIVAMALQYNRMVCRKAMARGGFLTGTGLAVSLLIPGPILIGVIPAMVVTIYLNKKVGKDTDVIAEAKAILVKLSQHPIAAKLLAEIEERIDQSSLVKQQAR